MVTTYGSLRLNGTPFIHRCEPGWRWAPKRPLPDHDLWYVMEGIGEMRLLGETHPLRPGVCFVVPPGALPSATQEPERRLHVFAIHFDFLDEAGAPVTRPLAPQGWCIGERAYFDGLARRCVERARRGGDGDSLAGRQTVLLVEQMLLHLWEEAARPAEDPADRKLREIAAAIRDAPGEGWDVAAQAARACLSRSQYTRRFTRLFGVPPARFVVDSRLERAAQLLHETDMTVSEIADALGYRDLFFFSRQFKARQGVPPSALRRSARPSVG